MGYVPVTVAGEVDFATVHRLRERLHGVTGDGRERDGTPAGAVWRGQGNYSGDVPGPAGQPGTGPALWAQSGCAWSWPRSSSRDSPVALKINSMLIGGG
jgi:hypothetical protein